MNNKKKIILSSIVVIILIGIIACIYLFTKEDAQYMSYLEFYNNVENQNVNNVLISENSVNFSLKNDDNIYYTENPDYDGFKEFLLLNNIKVEEETSYIYLLDVLFYLFFFGIVIFIIYKFIRLTSSFKVIKHNNTRFADIAGLEELKEDMIKTVDILKNPKKYEEKGIRAPKGIMLEGNPGNGKTLFARALAGEANINFIPTKATDFQSAMMSVGPAKIKSLFKKAEKNAPCIIFIDEFDGIGERRNYSGTGIDKENNRIITALLNELDGFDQKNGIMVIAATNSYNSLDPALIRAGRFDKKYQVTNPDKKARCELIDIYTKKKKIAKELSKDKLAEAFKGMTCSQIETILNESATISIIKEHEFIIEEDIVEATVKICNIKLNINK